jgi:hypothetical protein
MPRGDGTGPKGMGPVTGRGTGNCNNTSYRGGNGPGIFAKGMGVGRGQRRMFCVGSSMVGQSLTEEAVLKNEETFLEKKLQKVKERLKNLDGQK